jgi:sulfide dehydrogenase [flavocytochrome c] flavoprotein chain
MLQRRSFLQGAAAAGVLGLGACATTGVPSKARVLVVGGGYGGATAAKYVRLLSDYQIEVVLVEPNSAFVSCPISNLVLAGHRTMAEITTPYDNLVRRHGVRLVRDTVARVDPAQKVAVLAPPSPTTSSSSRPASTWSSTASRD